MTANKLSCEQEIEQMSKTRLQQLLDNEDEFKEWMFKQVDDESQENVVKELLDTNMSIANKTMQLKQELVHKQSELGKLQDEVVKAYEQYEQLYNRSSAQGKPAGNVKQTIVNELRNYIAQLDAECEQIHRAMINGDETDSATMNDLIESYRVKRKAFHIACMKLKMFQK
ncbi:hypothetical protein MP228_008888 [Amoeboaphelidium protococcarum]|nr:hypothetical protein MP228_008888 [Amoeboaphelidium protococcarum]